MVYVTLRDGGGEELVRRDRRRRRRGVRVGVEKLSVLWGKLRGETVRGARDIRTRARLDSTAAVLLINIKTARGENAGRY